MDERLEKVDAAYNHLWERVVEIFMQPMGDRISFVGISEGKVYFYLTISESKELPETLLVHQEEFHRTRKEDSIAAHTENLARTLGFKRIIRISKPLVVYKEL